MYDSAHFAASVAGISWGGLQTPLNRCVRQRSDTHFRLEACAAWTHEMFVYEMFPDPLGEILRD